MKRVASSEWEVGNRLPLLATRYSLLVYLFAVLSLCAPAAFALDIPAPPAQWYTDAAGLLDSSQGSALNEKLRAFEQQSGVQFIIYTLPSLQGEPLEDFTIRCAEKWKVGNKKYDNGLILFVFKNERKLRIEAGYGLEGTVTDAFSSRVISEYITPHFRAGDYAGGLNAGADALIAKIRGGEQPVPPTSPGATGRRSGEGTRLPGGFFLLLIIFALIILPRIFMRGGRHGCGGCLFPLMLWPGGGNTFGGGGFGGGGFGGGGFSGGGGSFGGGGASGGW
jgi:uncharacterized protein